VIQDNVNWSCNDTDHVGQQSQPDSDVRHVNDYESDVTSTPSVSRDPYLFRSPGWQQSTNCRKHSDVPPTDRCTVQSDITILRCDVTAAARTATASGLSAMADLLDEAPLFYIALTSGASFAACASSVCPSCVVALVAVTSFVSFVVDSVRRYVITDIAMR